jgi:hypothetical protein
LATTAARPGGCSRYRDAECSQLKRQGIGTPRPGYRQARRHRKVAEHRLSARTATRTPKQANRAMVTAGGRQICGMNPDTKLLRGRRRAWNPGDGGQVGQRVLERMKGRALPLRKGGTKPRRARTGAEPSPPLAARRYVLAPLGFEPGSTPARGCRLPHFLSDLSPQFGKLHI